MTGDDNQTSTSSSVDLESGTTKAVPPTATAVSGVGYALQPVESSPYGSRPACFSSTLQECLFVLTTTFAVGQSSIFSGVIICITNYVATDLHMTDAEVTWISAAQTLAAGCFLLFFGRVADLFGRRMMLLVSLAAFSICLIVMGFATDAIYLDVFCGLLGMCSAAAVPPAIGKLGAVYQKPSRRKNRAFACFSAGNPVGFALGALISGVTMIVSTWRATFWVMAVIYVFFTLVAWWTVPPDTEQTTGGFNKETLAKFDFLGAFLAVAGTAMFTASLTLAGNASAGWKTPYVIALLVIGFVFLVAFVYWQSVFSYPLMPLSMWRDRNFSVLVSTLCLGFYGFSGNFFWLTLLWQRIFHLTPIMVAVRLLPAAIGGIAINIVAALIMHRVSNKLLMIVGAVAFVASNALLSGMEVTSSFWAFEFPALMLGVVGADFEFTVTNMYVMSSLPSEQQSIAGGLFNTVSRLSATVGLGIGTSLYNALGGSSTGAGAVKYRPYQSTFWVALVGSVLALGLLPFITIKSQGARKKQQTPTAEEVTIEKST